ncbi:hypothetical protein IWQ56_005376, partial [Coemansia nantahalensis]
LVPGSTRFESRPLPPLPQEGTISKRSTAPAASPAPSAAMTDSRADDRAASRRQSTDESVLYMASRRSSSLCSDCGRAPNRDTLVDTPQPRPAYVASRASVDSLSTSGSAILQRTPSAASLDDGADQREASTATGPAACVAASPRPPAMFTTSDKRGSAQSEGETIVSSPRSERANIALDAASPAGSLRKAQRPELPELPTMESFSDMAFGLFARSPAFGKAQQPTSFWEGVRL